MRHLVLRRPCCCCCCSAAGSTARRMPGYAEPAQGMPARVSGTGPHSGPPIAARCFSASSAGAPMLGGHASQKRRLARSSRVMHGNIPASVLVNNQQQEARAPLQWHPICTATFWRVKAAIPPRTSRHSCPRVGRCRARWLPHRRTTGQAPAASCAETQLQVSTRLILRHYPVRCASSSLDMRKQHTSLTSLESKADCV